MLNTTEPQYPMTSSLSISVTVSANKALDAEPPIASYVKSMLIGGGPVNAGVSWLHDRTH